MALFFSITLIPSTPLLQKNHILTKNGAKVANIQRSVTNHGRPDDISMLLSILYFITYRTVAVLILPGCSFPAASHMYITTITTDNKHRFLCRCCAGEMNSPAQHHRPCPITKSAKYPSRSRKNYF